MNELAQIVSQNEEQIRSEWMRDMGKSAQRTDLIGKAELEEQCRTLLSAIAAGIKTSGPADISAAGWDTARDFLQEISTSRAQQGFSSSDVATFVLSLKQPLFRPSGALSLAVRTRCLRWFGRRHNYWIGWRSSPPKHSWPRGKNSSRGSSRNSLSFQPRWSSFGMMYLRFPSLALSTARAPRW